MAQYSTHDFLMTALLVKLPNTSTEDFYLCDRLKETLPGGPCSPEGSTEGTRVLSFTLKLH